MRVEEMKPSISPSWKPRSKVTRTFTQLVGRCGIVGGEFRDV